MTGRSDRRRSLYEERASTVAGAIGLAAARLAMQATRLLSAAKRESGLSSKDISSRLGVTEGRVSQVLNGDGNIHVATLARFMRAMGYTIELTAVPAQPDRKPLDIRSRRGRRRGDQAREYDLYEQRFLTVEGPMKIPMFVPADHILRSAPDGSLAYAGRVQVTASDRTRPVLPKPATWQVSELKLTVRRERREPCPTTHRS